MRLYLTWIVVLSGTGPLWAGGPSHWRHTSDTDFANGKLERVVATSLGDLKLSRAINSLMDADPRVTALYCLAEGPDGAVYAGTGPHGIVLQLQGGHVRTLAALEDPNIFSLLVDKDGQLLMGTGGRLGRILRLKPGRAEAKPVEIFRADGVQYVWRMVQSSDGMLYAATGPSGQIFQIHPDGKSSVLFDSDESNILSLLSDGQDILYAGSDPNGLVYRINRRTGEVFVIYDAAEAEITALALDAKGNLYLATGQSDDTEPASPAASPQADPAGRVEELGLPLPSPKPREPQPVPQPRPDPGDPDPIPRQKNDLIERIPLPPHGADDHNGAGADQSPPGTAAPNLPAPGTGLADTARARPPSSGGPIAAGGNAVYRVDREGFVTEVFRQPVVILTLIEKNGVLLIGTGNEGQVFHVDLAADEAAVLAKVDSQQVLSLLETRDGQVILGLANSGDLAVLSQGFASQGTYTSPVLDAGQISRFGRIRLQGTLPDKASLTVATRSGNHQQPGEIGWSKWSEEQPASEYVSISSPPARFFQYRLTFRSADGTTSAVVDEVDVVYQRPNQAPQIKSIRITAPDEGQNPRPSMVMPPATPAAAAENRAAGGRLRVVSWEASDPDGDPLVYTVHLRRGSRGQWILLQDKLTDPQFTWDTRGVADGRYQIRVTASDARNNPPGAGRIAARLSDTLIIDNRPPLIGDLKVLTQGAKVQVQARIVDQTSAVASAEYSIDSKDEWQMIQASDGIFDSPEETITVVLEGLSAGAHQLALRASDEHGNQAVEAIQVTIDVPEKKMP